MVLALLDTLNCFSRAVTLSFSCVACSGLRSRWWGFGERVGGRKGKKGDWETEECVWSYSVLCLIIWHDSAGRSNCSGSYGLNVG